MLSLPELDINSRSKLVEALFSCDCMKSLQSRSRVIQKLPSEIQQKISAGGNNKQDVDDTLDSCLQFEDGMERLLEVVKYYEGNSFAWQKLEEVWRQTSSKTLSPSAPHPPATASAPTGKRRRKSRSKYQYDVFLSHKSSDKVSVEKLAARLEDEAGLKPFLDKWHLVPGDPWQEALEDALDESTTYAVFLGPDGLGPWQNVEMRDAIDKRVRDKSRRVIPVLLPGAKLKDEKTLPRFLQQLAWVDFRNGIDDEKEFRRLIAGITGKQPGR